MRGIVREAGLRLLESLALRRVKVRPEGDEISGKLRKMVLIE
jgi:hypothetical protein